MSGCRFFGHNKKCFFFLFVKNNLSGESLKGGLGQESSGASALGRRGGGCWRRR